MEDQNLTNKQSANKQTWIDQVTKDLKGADFNEKLISNIDNIIIDPLYTRDDLPKFEEDSTADFFEEFEPEINNSEEKVSTPTWYVGEELFMNKNNQLEELVIASLKRGANFLTIHVEENNEWESIIDQIRKLKYPAYFSFNYNGDVTEDNIANKWRERIGKLGDRDRLVQAIEFDPIGYWIKSGNIENESKSFNALSDIFFRISGHLHDCKLIKIDISHPSISNQNCVDQLAAALAITSDYFDKLSERNVPLEELIQLISFRFSVGTDYFLEIEKLRAFRVLWNNLLKAFIEEIDFIPNPFIHVVIQDLQKENDEPHQNLLRISTKTMSAILGGCDAISISNTEVNESSDSEFNKRTATHIQNILRYESYMDTYRDAAKESFYIESLTAQLAEKAWEEFQRIENEGGFLTKLKTKL